MAGRSRGELVLADARRPVAPAGRRHGPGLPRSAAAVREVPPSPVRTLEPGGLLRPSRLLLSAWPQGPGRAAALFLGAPAHEQRDQPDDRQADRAEDPRWAVPDDCARRRPEAQAG